MNIELAIKIGTALCSFLLAAIPLAIMIWRLVKQKRALKKQLASASTDAEKADIKAKDAEATAAMLEYANEFVVQAEALYKDVDKLLKSQGLSAGVQKKDSVMSKLQAKAIELGYNFDAAKWSDIVDNIVAMTRKVNVK